MWHKGETNGLGDVVGIRVGHASDHNAKTGTSVVLFDSPAIASVSILGQAPGTRETELLDPSRTVDTIDALVLSGGSAFGLAAAEPVMQELAKAGRGFKAGPAHVPIVPAAILFDLANGGEKPDDLQALYRTLGQTAFHNADQSPRLGDVGAGTGATIGTGGSGALGTASCVFNEHAQEPLQDKTVAALVAVNAVGSPFLGQGPHLRAWPFELDEEFGGLGAGPVDPTQLFMKTLGEPGQNTTIGCIVTDIALDKRGCHSLAIAGQDGIAAAIYPAHTAMDGDLVFGASVGTNAPLLNPGLLALVQAAATATMARAIARGIYQVLQNARSML
jgi:L-aminopeptidase/D-esterase-like protein